jgi:hypothetical protein
MEAIAGDDTLWSYLCASLLWRELSEFGGRDAVSWDDHEILGERPSALGTAAHDPGVGLDAWTWFEQDPAHWAPMAVRSEGGVVEVSFYTCSRKGTQRIQRFEDRYPPASYVPETQWTPVAKGPYVLPRGI